MDTILSLIEARVLASLVEKSLTTPEYYPLTLNALAAACNQKSNREPLMQLSQEDIVRALDTLRDKKLAWAVTLAGSRVPKYRHSVTDVIPVTPQQLAVLCELMLRGPQTLGELRTRAARMATFTEAVEVQGVVRDLAAWPTGPLAAVLPRQPGQREERYAHLLCGPLPSDTATSQPSAEPARLTVIAENERIAALETKVTALEDDLAAMKAQFADFVRQFK